MRRPLLLAFALASLVPLAAEAQPYPYRRPPPPAYEAPPLAHLYRERFRDLTGNHTLDRLWSTRQGRVVPLSRAAEVYVAIDPRGRMTIRTGCNTLHAQLNTAGRGFRLGPVQSTRRACHGIAFYVEESLRSALPRVRDIYWRGQNLAFVDGRGSEVMTAGAWVR